MWSFYLAQAPPRFISTFRASMRRSTTPTYPAVPSTDGPYPPWQTCSDRVCSICSKDDEYRGAWQSLDPATSGPRTDPISLPSDFAWPSKCDADILREVIIPDSIASLSSSCFCQEQPVLITFNNKLENSPKLTTVMWSGQDDLPNAPAV